MIRLSFSRHLEVKKRSVLNNIKPAFDEATHEHVVHILLLLFPSPHSLSLAFVYFELLINSNRVLAVISKEL